MPTKSQWRSEACHRRPRGENCLHWWRHARDKACCLAGKIWGREREIRHSIPRWWWCFPYRQTDGPRKPGHFGENCVHNDAGELALTDEDKMSTMLGCSVAKQRASALGSLQLLPMDPNDILNRATGSKTRCRVSLAYANAFSITGLLFRESIELPMYSPGEGLVIWSFNCYPEQAAETTIELRWVF